MNVKSAEELKKFNESEKDYQEYNRLIKSPYPMAKVILYHKFGVGDCPCSNCQQ